jgi:hypothetical protein
MLEEKRDRKRHERQEMRTSSGEVQDKRLFREVDVQSLLHVVAIYRRCPMR